MSKFLSLAKVAGTVVTVLVSGVLLLACGSRLSQSPQSGEETQGSTISKISSGDCVELRVVGMTPQGSRISKIYAVECPPETDSTPNDDSAEQDDAILDDSAENDSVGEADNGTRQSTHDQVDDQTGLAQKLAQAAREVTAKARAEAGVEKTAALKDDSGI